MTVLNPAVDRVVGARVCAAADRIARLLTIPPPDRWQPGLRRPAVTSDLLRALVGGWASNGPVTVDPWSVPTGLPEGAEAWPTREAACSWLGVDRAVNLGASPPADAGLFAADPTRPFRLHARTWPGAAAGPSGGWLILDGLMLQHGPDGPRGLLAVTVTWRVVEDRSYVPAAHAGRAGFLLIVPAGELDDTGKAQVTGLTALVYLTPPAPEPGDRTLGQILALWRHRLLAQHQSYRRQGPRC